MAIDDVIRSDCPKEELQRCSKVIIDYTFRLKHGIVDPYVLISIGNWRTKEKLNKFKGIEEARRKINGIATDIRLFLKEAKRPKLTIECYYQRSGQGEQLVHENYHIK